MFKFCEIERKLKNGQMYNQGWLLEISSIEQLMTWFKNRNEIIDIWDDLKSPNGKRLHFANHKTFAYHFKIENKMDGNCSLVDFCNLYEETTLHPKIKFLNKYGKIYVNKVGSWCTLGDAKIKNFVDLDNLIFPNQHIKDFSITQFPNGTHYYISASGQAINICGVEKWDTYKEANKALNDYLNNKKSSKSKKDLFNE